MSEESRPKAAPTARASADPTDVSNLRPEDDNLGLDDILATISADLDAGARGRACLAVVMRNLANIREQVPHLDTLNHPIADYARAVDALAAREQLQQRPVERMLTVEEVAERAMLIKRNGDPRDSAYALIRRLGTKDGKRWLVAESVLEAHLRGGK